MVAASGTSVMGPFTRACGGVVALFVLAYVAASTGTEDVHPDEGTYHYLGWLWLSGNGLPLRDGMENKPPLIYLLFGLAHLVSAAPIFTMRVLALLATAAAGAGLHVLMCRVVSLPVATAAVLAWAMGVLHPGVELRAALTEPFMVACNVGAMALALSPRMTSTRAVMSGVLAATAFLFKPAMLLEGGVVAWACVSGAGSRPARWRDGLFLAAGAALPLLAVLGFYAWHGATGDLLSMVFFPPTPGVNAPPSAFTRLVMTLTLLAWLGGKAPGWLLALGALPRGDRDNPRDAHARRTGWTWLAAALPGVLAGWAWGHQYHQLGPPLAFLGALALSRVEATAFAGGVAASRGVAWLLVLVPASTLVANLQAAIMTFTPTVPRGTDEVVEVLRQRVAPGEKIFIHPVWDEVAARAERASVTRYFNGTYQSVPGAYDEILEAIRRTPPRALLVHKRVPFSDPFFDTEEHAPRREAFGRALRDHLSRDHVLVMEASDYQLFLRVDRAAAPPS